MLRTFDEKDLVSVVFYGINCFIYKDIAHALDMPYDQSIKPLSLYKECLIITSSKTLIEIFFRDHKDFESAKTQFLAAKEKVSTYEWAAALWKTSPVSADFLIDLKENMKLNYPLPSRSPVMDVLTDLKPLHDLKVVTIAGVKCFVTVKTAEALNLDFSSQHVLSVYKEFISAKQTDPEIEAEVCFSNQKDFDYVKVYFESIGCTVTVHQIIAQSREETGVAVPFEFDDQNVSLATRGNLLDKIDPNYGWSFRRLSGVVTKVIKETAFGVITIKQTELEDGSYKHNLILPPVLERLLPLHLLSLEQRVQFITNVDFDALVSKIETDVRDRIWNSFKWRPHEDCN